MKIVDCINQVPAPDLWIKLTADEKGIDFSDLTYVVNPYDEFAVEEALRIKEKNTGSNVLVVSMGTAKTIDAIRSCLALGADDAVHLKDDLFEGADANTTAFLLGEAIKKRGFDLILCGKQAVDDDNASVGIMLAEILNIPHIAVITKLEISADGKSAVAHREIEGAVEVIECPLPAVFTCQKGLNEPRYASLTNVMKAKKKPVEEIDKVKLAIADTSFSAKESSKAKVIKYSRPPKRSAGKIIPSENKEVAIQELIKVLTPII